MNIKFNLKLLKFLVIGILIFLITLSIVFRDLLTPNFRAINSSTGKIDTANNSLTSALKGNIIDPEIAKTVLSKSISQLKAEKDKLKNTQPPTKYKNSYNNLIVGIENNIKLYEQNLAILNSPSSQDLPTAFSNMLNYKSTCEKHYILCTNDGMKIKLTSNAIIYINNSSNYINSLVKLKRDSDIKNSQKNDFLVSIDNCIVQFSKINEDLTPTYDRLQKEHKGLQALIDDVNKKMANFSDLKNSIYSVSVPSDAIDYYSSFQEVLDLYDKYINDLYGKLKNNETPDNIKQAISYINQVNQSFNDFNKNYSAYKDN